MTLHGRPTYVVRSGLAVDWPAQCPVSPRGHRPGVSADTAFDVCGPCVREWVESLGCLFQELAFVCVHTKFTRGAQ